MIYAVLLFGLFWVHSSFVTLWQILILLRRILLQYCLHSQISIFHLIFVNVGHILVLELFLIISLSGMARIHSNASRFLSGGIENIARWSLAWVMSRYEMVFCLELLKYLLFCALSKERSSLRMLVDQRMSFVLLL